MKKFEVRQIFGIKGKKIKELIIFRIHVEYYKCSNNRNKYVIMLIRMNNNNIKHLALYIKKLIISI